jgi:CubicO group peptidase (beta-lactamase class C family)
MGSYHFPMPGATLEAMEALTEVAALLRAAVGPVFPAAQLLVVDEDATRLHLAVGDATSATRFDLASLTKPLCTAALVLRLVERGRVSMNDRPRPECTVRELLAHAGGLPAWRALGDPRAPGKGMHDGAIAAARVEPLAYPPGTRSIYSDLGFILLGDHVERSAGRELGACFAEELAAPLGADLRFGPVDGDVAPTEGGLVGVVHDDNARAMGGCAGHAGLFGNAEAVDRAVRAWVDAFHGRSSILPAALVREAWGGPQFPASTWGLGWDHPSTEASSAGERWPRTGVGHLAFTGCSIWIDPPRRRWVILLSNRVYPTRANEAIKAFRPRLHDAISAALDG